MNFKKQFEAGFCDEFWMTHTITTTQYLCISFELMSGVRLKPDPDCVQVLKPIGHQKYAQSSPCCTVSEDGAHWLKPLSVGMCMAKTSNITTNDTIQTNTQGVFASVQLCILAPFAKSCCWQTVRNKICGRLFGFRTFRMIGFVFFQYLNQFAFCMSALWFLYSTRKAFDIPSNGH